MKPYYKLLNLRALLSGFGALLLLASCSSYQYAGYDNDGIYSSSPEGEAYTANDYEDSYEDALYYKQLFAEKSEQFETIGENGIIFTDVDSYTSTGAYADQPFLEDGITYESGLPAWGSDPDEISINIYHDMFGNPFYNPYINPYYAGYYDPFYSPFRYGWGYPYHYPYGYGGYGYAYSSWGWNVGWGFGWNTWGHHYRPYYHGYWPGYYNSHYGYNPRNVAYNSGRRNSYSGSDYNGSVRSNDTYSRTSRVSRYSNPRDIRAGRSNLDVSNRTYSTRSTRVRSEASPLRRNDAYRTSERTFSRERSSVRTRSNADTRVRTSRPSTYNSGTVRSSSSSTRSSGSSSSGRSSRGRGN